MFKKVKNPFMHSNALGDVSKYYHSNNISIPLTRGKSNRKFLFSANFWSTTYDFARKAIFGLLIRVEVAVNG